MKIWANVIDCGVNDARLRLSAVTKLNVESVCSLVKTMSEKSFLFHKFQILAVTWIKLYRWVYGGTKIVGSCSNRS